MANIFALILVIATLVTGLLWCIDKIISFHKRYERKILMPNADVVNVEIEKKTFRKIRWMETGASAFPMLAIMLAFRSFIYEPFQIPSGSMMPTLLIGDFILVEKFAYGIKDPLYQKTLIKTGHPKRGDIVVFKYPEDSHLDYIKRAVGLPGDKVTYDPIAKEVILQPSCSFSTDAYASCDNAQPIVVYSNIKPGDFVQNFTYVNGYGAVATSGYFQLPKGEIKEKSIRLMERKETLGDVTHSILTVPIVQDRLGMYYRQQGQPLATWLIPPGHYFMMGDNRDNSADSRYWGFVPEANLVGKATAIWLSFDKKEEDKWPTGIRISRIGRIY